MSSSQSRGRFSIVKLFGLVILILAVGFSIFMTGSENILTVNAQNTTTLRFDSVADTYVEELQPDANYGSSPYLQVASTDQASSEGYIRFVVTGITGRVQSARLRIYMDTNNPTNIPALYTTNQLWTETKLTWQNRPGPIRVLDNQGEAKQNAWVEYIVTPRVLNDGNYNFVLVGISANETKFASREADHPPQLEVTFIPSNNSITSVPPTPFIIKTPTPFNDSLAPGDEVFVGAGDISTCKNNDDESTARLLDNIPGTVFVLGDNAYPDGTYDEYLTCYDPTWGRHKARTQPIPGNHEYNTSEAAGYFQYFDDPALFYAYNLGAWRIYALNSEINIAADSPQIAWLKKDLAANPRQCVLAYWHKPRWSSGAEHGSDPTMQTLWEVFADAGAELVLNGHDHDYERFTPMDRNGQPIEDGLREFVVGTGGAGLYSIETVLDTSEAHNDTSHGVLKLILRADSYDWEFVPIAGDTFTDSGSDNCH